MTGRSGFRVVATTLLVVSAVARASAQRVEYENKNGIQYKVTTQDVRVPETSMQSRSQTVYRQQLTTDTYQSTHYVAVPVTNYRLVSRMRGRWNPFVTPYWTHHYEPVTTWTQQAATVSVPVSKLAWVPETRTVQAPVTSYRTAQRVIREPIGMAPAGNSGQQYASNAPSATLARAPSSQRVATEIGGQRQDDGLPEQGWQRSEPGLANRY